MPDGTVAYTRDGTFKRDAQGRIVTSDGYPLEPEITIPAERHGHLDRRGRHRLASCCRASSAPQELGKIELAKFANPAGLLQHRARNLLQTTAASGEPITGTPGTERPGHARPGFLEMSNVKVVEEMVNMIVAQRAYEVNFEGHPDGRRDAEHREQPEAVIDMRTLFTLILVLTLAMAASAAPEVTVVSQAGVGSRRREGHSR